MAFLCCVEVGKVKFNERFTHQRKWDNESDIPQKHGNTVAFFSHLLGLEVNFKLFFPLQYKIKLETALKKKKDKYHHTATRICEEKKHKAAPRKSRHAKMIIFQKER